MEKELIMDDTDRLLSVEEVAERLRTGKQFVRRLINAGLLPALSFRRNSSHANKSKPQNADIQGVQQMQFLYQ